jgi:hypothetical protein
MRWTENATNAQKEVGYAEYPGYQASGSSAVAGGLTTRRGDATRPAHPAVTPGLCPISRLCLSQFVTPSRPESVWFTLRPQSQASDGGAGPEEAPRLYVLVGGGRLLVRRPDRVARSAGQPRRIRRHARPCDRADLLTIAVRRGPTLIRRCEVARQRHRLGRRGDRRPARRRCRPWRSRPRRTPSA